MGSPAGGAGAGGLAGAGAGVGGLGGAGAGAGGFGGGGASAQALEGSEVVTNSVDAAQPQRNERRVDCWSSSPHPSPMSKSVSLNIAVVVGVFVGVCRIGRELAKGNGNLMASAHEENVQSKNIISSVLHCN